MFSRCTRRPSVWRAASSRKYYGRQLVAALPLSSQDVHRRRANQAPGPTLRPAEVGQSHLVYIRTVVCSPRPNASKGSAASAGWSAKPPIEAQVIACHHVRGEPLLEHLAHYPAVKLIKLENRPYSLVFGIHNEPGFPVLHDLAYGPAPPSDHRRPTSHGFEQPQPKRHGPSEREQASAAAPTATRVFAVA